MSKYTFGNRVFRSKKEIAEVIKGIVGRYAIGDILTIDDTQFMIHVLEMHPRSKEKIGCGVARIRCAISPVWKTPCLLLTRSDGTETDFSWRQCLYPASRGSEVKKACREAVREQIRTVRNLYFGSERCPITGERITKANLHVDHEPPFTFAVIYKAWIEECHIDVKAVEITGHQDNSHIVEFADPELAKQFAEFHRECAKLRVLSAEGNYVVERMFKRGIVI